MHQKHNSDHFRDALPLFALCCYTSWTLYSDADDVVIERLSEMEEGEWQIEFVLGGTTRGWNHGWTVGQQDKRSETVKVVTSKGKQNTWTILVWIKTNLSHVIDRGIAYGLPSILAEILVALSWVLAYIWKSLAGPLLS